MNQDTSRRQHHPPHLAAAQAELADRLIERVLIHAEFDGWGEAALLQAARDIGADENLTMVLFPDLPKSLLVWASGYGDSVMHEWLSANKPEKITATIFAGLQFRYQHFKPYRGALSRAAKLFAHPNHIITAGELTWQTADVLWRAAGDQSNDFNYYSKRGLLAAIIAATLPVYLGDKSEHLKKTEQFLRHRLDNIKIINQLKAKLRDGWFGFRRSA